MLFNISNSQHLFNNSILKQNLKLFLIRRLNWFCIGSIFSILKPLDIDGLRVSMHEPCAQSNGRICTLALTEILKQFQLIYNCSIRRKSLSELMVIFQIILHQLDRSNRYQRIRSKMPYTDRKQKNRYQFLHDFIQATFVALNWIRLHLLLIISLFENSLFSQLMKLLDFLLDRCQASLWAESLLYSMYPSVYIGY